MLSSISDIKNYTRVYSFKYKVESELKNRGNE